MIRIDQIWLSVEPVDMRAGVDRLLARVVEVFGTSQPYHAYLFANRRGSRIKVLVSKAANLQATNGLHFLLPIIYSRA